MHQITFHFSVFSVFKDQHIKQENLKNHHLKSYTDPQYSSLSFEAVCICVRTPDLRLVARDVKQKTTGEGSITSAAAVPRWRAFIW